MHCTTCNATSPPQARYCIFCGACFAATGPTERLEPRKYLPGSVSPSSGYMGAPYHQGTIVKPAMLSGSVVVNMSNVIWDGSYYGTQAPRPSNMLFFDGQWYKVVPE